MLRSLTVFKMHLAQYESLKFSLFYSGVLQHLKSQKCALTDDLKQSFKVGRPSSSQTKI